VDSRVLLIKLRRNFGQTSALAAGFDHASASSFWPWMATCSTIPARSRLSGKAGEDTIGEWLRKERVDNLVMRRIPSRCANWLMAKLSGVDIHDFGTLTKLIAAR